MARASRSYFVQGPLGYVCDGSVSSGSYTTTCASPTCTSNAFSVAPVTGGDTRCTTGTGSWALSGCSGRLHFEYDREVTEQQVREIHNQVGPKEREWVFAALMDCLDSCPLSHLMYLFDAEK